MKIVYRWLSIIAVLMARNYNNDFSVHALNVASKSFQLSDVLMLKYGVKLSGGRRNNLASVCESLSNHDMHIANNVRFGKRHTGLERQRSRRDLSSQLIRQMTDMTSVNEQLDEPRLVASVEELKPPTQNIFDVASEKETSLFNVMPHMGASSRQVIADTGAELYSALPAVATITPVTIRAVVSQYGPPSVPLGAADVRYGAPSLGRQPTEFVRSETQSQVAQQSQTVKLSSDTGLSLDDTVTSIPDLASPMYRKREDVLITLSDGVIQLGTMSGPKIHLVTGRSGTVDADSQGDVIIVASTGSSTTKNVIDIGAVQQNTKATLNKAHSLPTIFDKKDPSAWIPVENTTSSDASQLRTYGSNSRSEVQQTLSPLSSHSNNQAASYRAPLKSQFSPGFDTKNRITSVSLDRPSAIAIQSSNTFERLRVTASPSHDATEKSINSRQTLKRMIVGDMQSYGQPSRDPPRDLSRDLPTSLYESSASDEQVYRSSTLESPSRNLMRDPLSSTYGIPTRDLARSSSSRTYIPPASDVHRNPSSPSYGLRAREPPRNPPSPFHLPSGRDPPGGMMMSSYSSPARDPPRNPPATAYGSPLRDTPMNPSLLTYWSLSRDPPRDPPSQAYGPPLQDTTKYPPSLSYGRPVRDPPRYSLSPSYNTPPKDPPRGPPSSVYGPPVRDPPRDPPYSSYVAPSRDPPSGPPSSAYGPPVRDPLRDPPSSSYGAPPRDPPASVYRPPDGDPPRDPPSSSYIVPSRDASRGPPSSVYTPPSRDPTRVPPSSSYGTPSRDLPINPPSQSFGPPDRDLPRDPPLSSYGLPEDPPRNPLSSFYGRPVRNPPRDMFTSSYGSAARDPPSNVPNDEITNRDPVPVVIVNPSRKRRKHHHKISNKRIKDTFIREIAYPNQNVLSPSFNPSRDTPMPQNNRNRNRLRPLKKTKQQNKMHPKTESSWRDTRNEPAQRPRTTGLVRDTLVREVMYDRFSRDYKRLFYKGALLIGAIALLPTIAIASAPLGRRRKRDLTESSFEELPDVGSELPSHVKDMLKSYLPEVSDPSRSQCLQMSLCNTLVEMENSPFRNSFLLYYAIIAPDTTKNPWMQQALTAARKHMCHRFVCSNDASVRNFQPRHRSKIFMSDRVQQSSRLYNNSTKMMT